MGPDSAPVIREGDPATHPAEKPPWAPTAPRGVLHGRDSELQRGAALLRRGGAGRAAVLVLSGQAGIGKTRLMEELMATAVAGGLRVVAGRSFEAEATGPYRTLRGPLRLLATEVGEVPDPRLSVVLSTPAGAWTEAPDRSAADEADRLLLFDAAASLVETAASRTPLVIALDDIQWADRASLDLLAHLVDRCAERDLTVVATCRHDEVGDDHPAAESLARMARRTTFCELRLDGLPEAAARAFVADQADIGADSALATEIATRADGNPYLCRELAWAVSQTGSDSSADLLPASVDRLLGRRLSRLGDEAVRLLRLVSLSSRGLAWRLAEIVVEGDDLYRPLDVLLSNHAVIERNLDDDVVLVVEHDLLRAAVVQRLSKAEQAAIHRCLAGGAESLARAEPRRWVSTAAYHWDRAGRAGDPDRAVRCCREAGRIATRTTAFEDARRHLERAVEAEGWLDGDPDPTLLVELADACRRVGDTPARRDHSRDAFELGLLRDDLDTTARAAILYAGSRSTYGVADPAATSMLERADLALSAAGRLDGLTAMVRARLAQELNHRGELDRSRDLTAHAMDLAFASGDAAAVGPVFRERIWTLNHPDHLAERVRLIDELVDRADALGDVELEMEARVWRAAALLEVGDADSLDREVERLGCCLRGCPIPSIRVRLLTLRTTLASMRGDYDEALRLATATFEVGVDVEPANAEQVLRAQLIAPLRDTGRLGEVVPAVMSSAGEYRAVLGWRCALAFVLAEAGDVEASAREVAAIATAGLGTIRRDLAWAQAITFLADTVCTLAATAPVEQGLVDELIALIEPFSGRNASLWDIATNGAFDHYLARLHAAVGRWDAAANSARRAIERHRADRCAPMALRSALVLRDVAAGAENAGTPLDRSVFEHLVPLESLRAEAIANRWEGLLREIDRRARC
ncbi:MAG: ATP-binding protein [Microthrixaceae bacterium]